MELSSFGQTLLCYIFIFVLLCWFCQTPIHWLIGQFVDTAFDVWEWWRRKSTK